MSIENRIISVLFTLVILCVIIIVHEFGHMIVAKSNGIFVKEFWVGFGPTLLSFTKNDTKYCLKPVPFGEPAFSRRIPSVKIRTGCLAGQAFGPEY